MTRHTRRSWRLRGTAKNQVQSQNEKTTINTEEESNGEQRRSTTHQQGTDRARTSSGGDVQSTELKHMRLHKRKKRMLYAI